MDEIKDQLNKLDEKLDNVDKTLIVQAEQLKTHIYRTELAEKRLEHIEGGMVPVNAHINKVEGAFKALGVLALVVGIIAGLARIFL